VSAGLGPSIRDAHVLVTTGAGGVGKTTTPPRSASPRHARVAAPSC
jgi:anion-transporting  ArsA/GET3 family ATPase